MKNAMDNYKEQFYEFVDKVSQFRKQKKRIVLCHGCFDPLHIGHVLHFRAARRYGDVLAVTVTPDRFVKKGKNRPLFPDKLRLEMIKELKSVDAAAINLWESAVETIKRIQPDFFAKGGDYRDLKNCNPNIIIEKMAIEESGGKLVFTDEISFSSTELIEWINKC